MGFVWYKIIIGGGHFKVDEEIGLPLTQCQFYSGNPHIVSIDRGSKLYKPIHLKWWNDMTKVLTLRKRIDGHNSKGCQTIRNRTST